MGVYARPNSSHLWIDFVVNGRRVRQSAKTANRRKALALERELRAKLEVNAAPPAAQPTTLEEALNRYWIGVIKPRGKRRSSQNTRYILDRIRAHFGPHRMLDSIDTGSVSRFADWLLAQGLAPSTVNRNLNVIQAVLNKAHKEWEVLERVPYVARKPTPPEKTRYLSDGEVDRLLGASPPHLHDLLEFMLGTGARMREATHLKWRDVHLANGTRGFVRFTETKGERARSVPLPRGIESLLRRLKAEAPEGEERVFLYARRDGHRVPYDNPKKAFAAARERAGLLGIRLHDLRHTYASRLVQRGRGLYEVQRLLGHADPSQTQRYASLAPNNLEASVEVLDD